MFDLERFKLESDQFTKSLGNLLGINIFNKVFINALGSTRIKLYEVAVFFGQEADRCRETGAYFSCCVMTASAIEALLALLCLSREKEVSSLNAFRTFRKGNSYEEKVLSADFQSYIDVASELGWVPSSAVSADVLQAAIQDFPIVCLNLYPNLSPEKRKGMAERFEDQPGIEMLKMMQHLRNLVHPSRWARFGIAINLEEFDSDSKFIYIIAHQVLYCLMSTYKDIATKGIDDIGKMKEQLSPEQWASLVQQAQKAMEPVPGMSKDEAVDRMRNRDVRASGGAGDDGGLLKPG